MRETKIEIDEMYLGAVVKIELPTGKRYRLNVFDGQAEISISTSDGPLVIIPQASNTIKVTTA